MKSPTYVLGPDGAPLTLADLPSEHTKRWVVRRKAEVVYAVEGGIISRKDALTKYQISEDEFNNWVRQVKAHGVAGLRVTRIQNYR